MKKANVAIFVPNLGCPHLCSFCDQRMIAGRAAAPTPEEVEDTARRALDSLGERAKNAEIAFFGGSFTAIEPRYRTALLRAARPFVGPGGFHGIRVSTRPDAVDGEILSTLREYGVTAVELGAQSMDRRVLTLNRRGHSPQDVVNASRLIRQSGLELGLQMMTGLYGATPQTDRQTAHALAALSPDTVRIYPTVVLEHTMLARLWRAGEYRPQQLSQAVSLCASLLEFFGSLSIPVIRLGLHAEKSLEESYLAGPWHPAFRELCEGELYRERARAALAGLAGDCRAATLLVAPRAVSKLAGQHRQNLTALEQEFRMRLIIRTSPLPDFTVEARADA